jgi:uncharacterized protein YdiU (UPF0061 family)
MAFHYKKIEELNALISYTQKTFFKNMGINEMLRKIVTDTAKLIAQWQSVGFCHGVMNTDNMSVLSFTIDYGPFGFLEDTNLNHICNHSDHEGRYAFSEQPKIALWNLERLLICFQNHETKDNLSEILHLFPQAFEDEYLRIVRQKLGFNMTQSSDYDLFETIIRLMDDKRIDYTFFFRQLSHYKKENIKSMPTLWKFYHQFPELITWFKLYDERLLWENSDDKTRQIEMQKVNPKYILRNYIAQIVIDDVEKNQSKKLEEWLNVFNTPFAEHSLFEGYSHPTPREKSGLIVSCSS